MKTSLKSLPVRLSLCICSILLVVILAGTSLIAYLWFNDLSDMLHEHGATVTQETAFQLDQIFVQAEQSAKTIATLFEKFPPQKEQVQPILESMLPSIYRQCPDLSGIAFAWRDGALVPDEKNNAFLQYEKDGTFHSVNLSEIEFDYMSQDWFIVPSALEKPIWTIPFESKGGMNSLLLAYSTPFYKTVDETRTLAGVIVVDIKMDDLTKYLQKKNKTGVERISSQSEIFLINQFGQIVGYPGDESELNKTIFSLCDEPDEPDPQDRLAARSMFAKSSGEIKLQKAPILDGPCSLFFARCSNGWTVCAAIPQNWIFRSLFPLFAKFLLGWLVAVVLIVFVIFAVCQRLNKPLLALSCAAEAVGRGNFAAPLPATTSDDEIGRLTQSFGRMQSELVDYIARLQENLTARERAEGELNAARKIQQDILPHILPPLEGFTNVRAAGSLNPARGIGGDLYDAFPLDSDRLAFIIGDVSGKGIPAALFMAVTQTLQRNLARTESQPNALAEQLNDTLSQNNDSNMFVTWWLGVLNVQSGELTYCNGGHNPPILKRANGELQWLRDRHGTPLAVVPKHRFTQSQIKLNEGDVVLLYTDGVTEALNENNELFGEHRLEKTVADSKSDSPDELLSEVRAAVSEFAGSTEQSDDVTLLAVQYKEPTTNRRELILTAKMENLAPALEFIEKIPEVQHLSGKSRNQLLVSVEEIFVNIVHYAYQGGEGEVVISSDVYDERRQIRIQFSDVGPYFNPLEKTEPDITLAADERDIGGLGIFIVRKSMDYIDYQYIDGKNVLTIGKNIE